MISTWSFKFPATDWENDERATRRGREAFSQLAAEPPVLLAVSPSSCSLAWMPFISSDQWDRNKMDTEPGTRVFFRHPPSPYPSGDGMGVRRVSVSSLSFLSLRENRCRAGGQPTGVLIEYIKHTAERRMVYVA